MQHQQQQQRRRTSRSPSSPPPPISSHTIRKRGSLSGPALLFTSPEGPLIERERSSSPRMSSELASTRMDLSNLPRDYLESFPYPAFVLFVPVPPPAERDAQDADELPIPQPGHAVPFTRTSPSSTQPFDPVWTNEKWRNLSQGKRLLDCVTVQGARQFGDWISGARAMRGMRRASARSDRSQFRPPPGLPLPPGLKGGDDPMSSGPPENFWEPENPPYEDRSTSSDPHSASDTGIMEYSADRPGPMTLIMEIENPVKVTLELTKTSIPVYQLGHGGVRNRMETHTFLIITTIPRSPLVISPLSPSSHAQRLPSAVDDLHISDRMPGLASTSSPLPRTTILDDKTPVKPVSQLPAHALHDVAPASSETLTPTDEIMALDLPAINAGASGRPLYFNRDGTISRPHASFPSSGRDARGKSLNVHELLKTTDWSKTALGPMDKWPQSLRTILSLIMAYPHQCCLWWGPELTLIYNTPYAEMLHKHPDAFGTSGPVAWAEIWNSIGPLSELVLSGTPVSKEDDFLLFKQLPHQGGGTFEVYHSWMWVPVLQEDGTFGGLWNATIETTKKVLAERRLAAVREMGERTSIARTEKEFDNAVLDILTSNPRDAPFAALYHVDIPVEKPLLPNGNKVPNMPTVGPRGSSRKGQKVNLRLAGSIGIPDGHTSTPSALTVYLEERNPRDSRSIPFTSSPTMSIISGHSGQPTDEDMRGGMETWPLKEALSSRRLVLVEDCSALIQGYPIRVWDELPNAAVVVPIANDSDEGIPSTVLVIGLNIRRPFDDEYEAFVHVLRLQLASGITAVRSYEAERQRIEELAALDRAKSLLFSNVSHELRTPLTLVAGPLDDMLRETTDGPKKELLTMARRNVRRLTRLVSTLMDVSRLEAGRLKGSYRMVNLGNVTRDLAALFRGAIERAKLRYVVECDLTPRNTYVDLEHWEKIIFNLIGNAMKYTLHGFVHLALSYGPHEAILSVKDSGVGIPASDIDLIGERFHRVQSVSRSHEGTGIGLALIKELIKLHGGVLEIESLTASESTDGSHGSVFRVRIPLGFDHLPRDAIEVGPSTGPNNTTYGEGIVDEAMQWNRDREGSSIDSSSASDSGGTNGAESSNQSSRGIDPSTLYFKKEDTIMLVDDSFDTRRYMKSIFAPFCSIVEARDGLEALELAPKIMPDLIISDVMMPKLDGFGLLNALREDKSLEMIPVIMLTARGGEEYKVEGLLAGADDYLAKPFNARELIARAHMQVQLGKRRRQLEQAFQERTSELRTLSELPPAGIFRTTDDGTVTYANTAWYEMTGYPMGEEVTRWDDYLHPDHRDDVVAWWNHVITSDEAMLTTEFQYVNGKWVFCKVVRLRDFKFGLNGILGCVMDITERKVNEEIQRNRMLEAEQRRIEAEEAKRQQELLIDITSCVPSRPVTNANGSHEIRNPISSLMQIIVKTNLLALQEQLEMAISSNQGFQPTKQLLTTINEDLEALESIYQCGLAQERISNDVLSLGRIQLDMLQMFDVETDIRNEAQKVISIFQNEARMKRISLSLKLGEGIEKLGVTTIKTDPVRLGQVVTNLLSNGIRFTSTSKIRQIELKFDLSYDPPLGTSCLMPRVPEYRSLKEDMPVYLYVSVTDTGPGMTPKELELLFQRFSQVSPKTHTIFGGSGLGLFVCRKITEIMGGRIEVASEHGKGSTFRFFIEVRTGQPQKRSATPSADVDMASRPPLKKRHTGGKGGATGPKPHVLIVEDNLINQTVLMRQLKHVGLTCEVANNGLEALEKIRRVASRDAQPQGQPFDCVLMDLEMPVMDGLTALRHIREEEAAGTLSLNLVIALTGNARQGQIDEAKRAGMDEVVIKPYRLDDLLQKIEAMVLLRSQKLGTTSPRAAKAELR